MRGKYSFFSSTCHNSFARLPLNWSLSRMLMLRESGSLRLPSLPPPSFPSLPSFPGPCWPDNGRQPMPTEHAQEEQGYVGQIGADSQSDQFK